MSKLRSEIHVRCGDCPAQPHVEQNPPLHFTKEPTLSSSMAKNRLSLNLPIENYSDSGDEGRDSLNGESPLDEFSALKAAKAPRTKLEISPTDSAFYSDDFSPECSYESDGLLSAFSGSASCQEIHPTPSPEVTGYRLTKPGTHSLSDLSSCSVSRGAKLYDRSLLNVERFDGSSKLNKSKKNSLGWDSCWSVDVLSEDSSSIAKEVVPSFIPASHSPVSPGTKSRIIEDFLEVSDTCSIAESVQSRASKASLHEMAFLVELRDCSVGSGKVARFSCQLMGRRAASVLWAHGSRVVQNGGKYRIYRRGRTHSLEIYFTTFADSGWVTCRALHRNMEVESRAYLRVRESRLAPRLPAFVIPLESQETVPGEDVELFCKVRGHPVPVLNWYFNDRRISLMDSGFEIEHIGNEEWLIWIDGKRVSQAVTVKCLASNPLGECISSASVIVVRPRTAPAIHKPLSPKQMLNCQIEDIDKRLNFTKGQVLESAESMLDNASQMSSLSNKLKSVDAYLDIIECDFIQSAAPPVAVVVPQPATPVSQQNHDHVDDDQQKPAPPQTLLTGPSLSNSTTKNRPKESTMQTTEGTKVDAFSQPANPYRQDTSVSCLHSKSKPSVSITVLSKLASSDDVQVVFQKDFCSDSELEDNGEDIESSRHDSIVMIRADDSSSIGVKDGSEGSGAACPGGEENPYSREALAKRLAESNRRRFEIAFGVHSDELNEALDERRPEVRSPLLLPDKAERLRNYERGYKVNWQKADGWEEGSGFRDDCCSPGPDLRLQNSVMDKVSRASDKLGRLEDQIIVLQNRLSDDSICHPEELDQLQSAVLRTAAQLNANENTIKQVESLVSQLYQESLRTSPTCGSAGSSCYTPPETPSVSITYSNMTSTPQDFPQEAPSVKALMNRFQVDKAKMDNGHRRMGSVTSDDGSDGSLTSSPDKDRKPLPVFNKTKFEESVAAARALPKPKIHASLTARSLSREMREQLRIARPQMGAFRSNIMTAENADYDPEKAQKAKELFAKNAKAEQNSEVTETGNEEQQNGFHNGTNGHRANGTLNRFKNVDQITETHEELEEDSPKEGSVLESDEEDSYDVPGNSGFSNGHMKNASQAYDDEDSLDEEVDLNNQDHDEAIDVKSVENLRMDSLMRNGTHEENGHHAEVTGIEEQTMTSRNTGDDEAEIPLTQAPDWALMI